MSLALLVLQALSCQLQGCHIPGKMVKAICAARVLEDHSNQEQALPSHFSILDHFMN